MSKTRATFALGLVVFAAGLTVAHPDDRKLLDRLPPYVGAGFVGGSSVEAGVGFDNSGVLLQSWLTLDDLGASSDGNDCWGYVSPSGREYAIIGHLTGTTFVEITDPTSPVVVGMISGPPSIWRDMKVYNEYAYIVSEGGGDVQIIDLTQIDAGVVSNIGTVGDAGTVSTHNVIVNAETGFLYRVGGGSNGLRVYSLENPTAPKFVDWWTDRYIHDAQIVVLKTGPFAGREIAFCCSGFNGGFTDTGIDILDVTDKNNIVNLGRIVYPGGEYSHQCALSPDEKYLYINDELEEQRNGLNSTTVVINVEDLLNPQYVGRFSNLSNSITHNTYIRDGILFAANYRSGVRLFDMTNPIAGEEFAFFDTFPGSDSPNFSGLWGVFPFFPSGTVIGSDIQRGLFVWKLAFPTANIEFTEELPGFIPESGSTISFNLTSPFGALPDPDSFVLKVRAQGDTEYTDIPIPAPAEGVPFVAAFGDIPCDTVVEYFVTGFTIDGTRITDPPDGGDAPYTTIVATNEQVAFFDDAETEMGWTVGDPSDTATTGIWERIDPIGTDAQPEDDASPGGTLAWITGQHTPGETVGFNDVDGGATTLLSPLLDGLAEPGVVIVSYDRWYSNDQGTAANADTFFVQISSDNGATWFDLEAYNGNTNSWVRRSFQADQFVTPTSEMRIRFVASDFGSGSIVEAGVDNIDLTFFNCESVNTCAGDCNGSGAIDFDDLVAMLFQFGTADPLCDADASGAVDFNDLVATLFLFGPCP